MGVSTAFHLAENGVGSIVVIERDLLGSGSSAKPLGGVRATFSDPGNIVLAQRSLEAYERFAAEFGVDIGLRQVGYLFLCRTEKELAAVESSTELQNRLASSSEMVSPGRAAQLNPFIDPSVLLGASFSPRDGIRPAGPGRPRLRRGGSRPGRRLQRTDRRHCDRHLRRQGDGSPHEPWTGEDRHRDLCSRGLVAAHR
jgi:sarcosine oxidase, subunit beta